MPAFLRNITKTTFIRFQDFTIDFTVGFVEYIAVNVILNNVQNSYAFVETSRGGCITKTTTALLGSQAVVKTTIKATPNL